MTVEIVLAVIMVVTGDSIPVEMVVIDDCGSVEQ